MRKRQHELNQLRDDVLRRGELDIARELQSRILDDEARTLSTKAEKLIARAQHSDAKIALQKSLKIKQRSKAYWLSYLAEVGTGSPLGQLIYLLEKAVSLPACPQDVTIELIKLEGSGMLAALDATDMLLKLTHGFPHQLAREYFAKKIHALAPTKCIALLEPIQTTLSESSVALLAVTYFYSNLPQKVVDLIQMRRINQLGMLQLLGDSYFELGEFRNAIECYQRESIKASAANHPIAGAVAESSLALARNECGEDHSITFEESRNSFLRCLDQQLEGTSFWLSGAEHYNFQKNVQVAATKFSH